MKRYCKRGHDTFVVGRGNSSTNRGCRECERTRHRLFMRRLRAERAYRKFVGPAPKRGRTRVETYTISSILARRAGKLQELANLYEESQNG